MTKALNIDRNVDQVDALLRVIEHLNLNIFSSSEGRLYKFTATGNKTRAVPHRFGFTPRQALVMFESGTGAIAITLDETNINVTTSGVSGTYVAYVFVGDFGGGVEVTL